MFKAEDTLVTYLFAPAIFVFSWLGSVTLGFLDFFRAPLAVLLGGKLAELLTTPVGFAAALGFAGVCVQAGVRLYESELRRHARAQLAHIKQQARRISELETQVRR